MTAPVNDPVHYPSHYTVHPSGVEAIQVTEHLNFCVGNAAKYLWRAGLKSDNPVQDLEKAAWYLDREIQILVRGPELSFWEGFERYRQAEANKNVKDAQTYIHWAALDNYEGSLATLNLRIARGLIQAEIDRLKADDSA